MLSEVPGGRAAKVAEVTFKIDQLRYKQAILLDELRVWAELEFRVDLLKGEHRKWYDLAIKHNVHNGGKVNGCPDWVGPWLFNPGPPRWFNAVKLACGTEVPLLKFIRAAKREVLDE